MHIMPYCSHAVTRDSCKQTLQVNFGLTFWSKKRKKKKHPANLDICRKSVVGAGLQLANLNLIPAMFSDICVRMHQNNALNGIYHFELQAG